MSIFRADVKTGSFRLLWLVCLAAMCWGCGSSQMPLVKVQGKVTLGENR